MLGKKRDRVVCWLCDTEIKGIPHNAEPVSIGVCCNKCNLSKVIPARMEMIING